MCCRTSSLLIFPVKYWRSVALLDRAGPLGALGAKTILNRFLCGNYLIKSKMCKNKPYQ